MKIWKSYFTLEDLNRRCENTLISHLDIVFTEIGDNFLKAAMPVDRKVVQPTGSLHGGASCVLAETIGSCAGNFCVDKEKQYCLGLEINTNHLRPASHGILTGTGRPYHLGKKTQVWSIEIHNAEGKLISISRHTLCVLDIVD